MWERPWEPQEPPAEFSISLFFNCQDFLVLPDGSSFWLVKATLGAKYPGIICS